MVENPASDGASVVDGGWKRVVRSETIFHVHHDAANCAAYYS